MHSPFLCRYYRGFVEVSRQFSYTFGLANANEQIRDAAPIDGQVLSAAHAALSYMHNGDYDDEEYDPEEYDHAEDACPILLNVYVHAVAVKLEIGELERLAVSKFSQRAGVERESPGFADAVREIYREGAHSKPPSSPTVGQSRIFSRFPLLSFYRGFSVTMLGIIPYAGTNFLAWGYLRATFLPPKSERKKPTPIADLVIGAISGASGQTVSYPLEVIRRRMQVGGLTQPDRWIGFGETVRRIWATSGWRGFYVGLSIGYLKIVPMTATSFAVWQWAKRLLDV